MYEKSHDVAMDLMGELGRRQSCVDVGATAVLCQKMGARLRDKSPLGVHRNP